MSDEESSPVRVIKAKVSMHGGHAHVRIFMGRTKVGMALQGTLVMHPLDAGLFCGCLLFGSAKDDPVCAVEIGVESEVKPEGE